MKASRLRNTCLHVDQGWRRGLKAMAMGWPRHDKPGHASSRRAYQGGSR